MLISQEELLKKLENLKKEELTDYKKKYYNDIWAAEYNLLDEVIKIVTS